MKTTTLSLDFQAHMNVVAVLDNQQGNLGTLRLCTRIVEKIELSEEEKGQIGYVVVPHPNGAQLPAWNRNATLPPKDVTLPPEEASKLREVLESCPFFKRSDLHWLEPLVQQLNTVRPE